MATCSTDTGIWTASRQTRCFKSAKLRSDTERPVEAIPKFFFSSDTSGDGGGSEDGGRSSDDGSTDDGSRSHKVRSRSGGTPRAGPMQHPLKAPKRLIREQGVSYCPPYSMRTVHVRM